MELALCGQSSWLYADNELALCGQKKGYGVGSMRTKLKMSFSTSCDKSRPYNSPLLQKTSFNYARAY